MREKAEVRRGALRSRFLRENCKDQGQRAHKTCHLILRVCYCRRVLSTYKKKKAAQTTKSCKRLNSELCRARSMATLYKEFACLFVCF